MIPSREHFLLNLLKALSTDSFSPTLIVDTVFHLLIFEMPIKYNKGRLNLSNDFYGYSGRLKIFLYYRHYDVYYNSRDYGYAVQRNDE